MHVGLIMDGNGRWATAQSLPRLSGHRAGVEVLKDIIRACPALGVDTVTLFAFAIANWERDKEEVDGLWSLFKIFIEHDLALLIQEGVKVVVIGDKAGLPVSIIKSVETAEQTSEKNTKFLLQVALNYDGVDEVARLVKKVIREGIAPEAITSSYIKDNLDTEAGNEPDVIVRTGMPAPHGGLGVWRSSAFLPIQSAQSVCISTDVLWPDFTPLHLKEIIEYADPGARLFGGQRRIETSASQA